MIYSFTIYAQWRPSYAKQRFNLLEKIFNCFIELDFMNRTTKRRILKKVSTWLVKRTKVCAMKTNMPTLNMVHVKNMIGKSFIQLLLYVHERKEIGHMVICLCLFLHNIMTACKIAIKYTVTSKLLCNMRGTCMLVCV